MVYAPQDIRPCDALFLAEIVTEMRQLLEDPDVENPECPARQRIEYVWGEFRKLYVNKVALYCPSFPQGSVPKYNPLREVPFRVGLTLCSLPRLCPAC